MAGKAAGTFSRFQFFSAAMGLSPVSSYPTVRLIFIQNGHTALFTLEQILGEQFHRNAFRNKINQSHSVTDLL